MFFGLGAVGSSMLICLAELAERDGIPVRFKVFAIDPAGARDALYHAERLMKRIEIVGVPSFDPLLALEGPGADKLAGAALRERGVAALINMGVSPGITNFLIGDQICRIGSEHRKELEIESRIGRPMALRQASAERGGS